MGVSEHYLEWFRERYLRAGRRRKGELLTEFCELAKCHRKHATRLLRRRSRGRPPNSAGKRGRKSTYGGVDFQNALRRLWLETEQMCSKRLKQAIPEWLPFFEKHYGVQSEEVRTKLLKISAPTIDRILKPARARYGKSPSGTKPGTLLREEIAIQGTSWDTGVPGFVEADTVAHCGTSMQGEFTWSLTLTDINTQWTETRAVWHKGAKGIIVMVREIEDHLPFELKGFDCDNGGEFINHHLKRYFAENHAKRGPFIFTRSRPYMKNDNAHVEQRNWSHARQLFGRDRLDFIDLVEMMNDIYRNEFSLFRNHFCPTMKLRGKVLVKSRYRRHYESAKTPYQRVMESNFVAPEVKERLMAQHETLDPIELRRRVNAKMKTFYREVNLRRLKQNAAAAA